VDGRRCPEINQDLAGPMTRDEAKAILQVWRPVARTPGRSLREALKTLEQDAELARWFAGQKR